MRKVKDGTFRVSEDQSHTDAVTDLVDFCHDAGIAVATRTAFVAALSLIVRVPEFDPAIFKRRIAKAPSIVIKQTSRKDYMTIIEEVYNYGAKGKRIPVAFKALEIARERQLNSKKRAEVTSPQRRTSPAVVTAASVTV